VGVSDKPSRDGEEPWTDLVETLLDGDRRAVMAAIANSILEGWRPKRRSVELLVAYATGALTMEEYRRRIIVEFGH
jgi:hypothetical protein